MRLTANHEAIAHLTKGLEIVEGMGAGPEKDQYELDMLLVMGPAMVSVKGYSASEVEPTLRRALALCQQLGDVKKEFSVLQGLALFVFISGKHKDGETLARQMVELAKSREDPGPDLSAARQLAYCLTFQGDIDGSMTQFRHVIDTYDIQVHNKFTFQHTGSDAGVGSNSLMGIALVAYGYPDQARECFDKGFKLARDLDHKLSEAVAVWAAGFTQMMIGDQHTTREHAQALSEISKELGFVQYIVWADVQLSWVSFQEGGGSKAIEALKEAIQICRKIGSHAICTYWNVLMADALRRNDHPEESLALVEDVLNELEQTGERMWQSEANRIKGLSLLESGSSNFDEAEICFLKALEVARSQNARGWELKAATSLAELWISQDKPDQARELLKPVYDWFTEGFDTRDLTCAKKVLEQIQS